MVISTMQVQEDSAKPDFCTRGTRFGTHSTNESFFAPYYGSCCSSPISTAACASSDIRDPYHTQEVAHFIPPVNANTRPTTVTINGVTQTFFDVSTDKSVESMIRPHLYRRRLAAERTSCSGQRQADRRQGQGGRWQIEVPEPLRSRNLALKA